MTELWLSQEDWAEREAKFCDQMAAEYRGPLLDGWKSRPDFTDNAFMMAKCLINAECWEQMARHLRQPRAVRLERESCEEAEKSSKTVVEVPREPTKAMIDAGMNTVVGCCSPDKNEARDIWLDMYDAFQEESNKLV